MWAKDCHAIPPAWRTHDNACPRLCQKANGVPRRKDGEFRPGNAKWPQLELYRQKNCPIRERWTESDSPSDRGVRTTLDSTQMTDPVRTTDEKGLFGGGRSRRSGPPAFEASDRVAGNRRVVGRGEPGGSARSGP